MLVFTIVCTICWVEL